MSQEEVYRAIPHRPPFLFVDRVCELTDEGAVTERTLRADESFYEGHYPGNPITPGVLLCEAVFQTAAIYLVNKLEKSGESATGKTPILSRIRDARFKNMVKPGETVEISVSMKETVKQFHFLTGIIRKEGKTVLTIEFALALIDESPAQ